MCPGNNELGGFRRACVSELYLFRLHNSFWYECVDAQDYKSRKTETIKGFVREQFNNFNCPCRRICDCVVAIAVRTYQDKVQLFGFRRAHQGQPRGRQHAERLLRLLWHVHPLSSEAMPILKNFSSWKHVPSDKKSQSAMNQRVSRKRKELMVALIPGINIDGIEGAMTQLA
jgi:hypothetical protein